MRHPCSTAHQSPRMFQFTSHKAQEKQASPNVLLGSDWEEYGCYCEGQTAKLHGPSLVLCKIFILKLTNDSDLTFTLENK